MSQAPATENLSLEALVGRVADEFIDRLDRGEQPNAEEYAGRYPQVAAVLREVLQALLLVRVSGPPSAAHDAASNSEHPAVGLLGDFRIVREVGRGGMGVVYEAEQISLGRRVALKVLPFASTLDARQLQRFKNKAQAAAHLHHQHIVPVHATGCERGVHYYAMQFIEGHSLAEVIAEMRGEGRGGRGEGRGARGEESQEAAAKSATLHPSRSTLHASLSTLAPGPSPLAPSSTFRTAAQLGAQAADALEHAHDMGVIHRDIKPANLLVDGRGHLWVTDFGLAHCQSQVGLTLSGDLVGTLRYMSPEQALAKRMLVDHRTDIYSLGVTLYELLTREPAFGGKDRQELLRQIAFEEPPPPRRLNKAVPVELETIVLKAMAKDPRERYARALELSEDLRFFLSDRPIRARRVSLPGRAWRWCRRNPALAGVSGLAVGTLLVLSWAPPLRSACVRNMNARTWRCKRRKRNACSRNNCRASWPWSAAWACANGGSRLKVCSGWRKACVALRPPRFRTNKRSESTLPPGGISFIPCAPSSRIRRRCWPRLSAPMVSGL
jgi:serine/threonine protein kinase